MPKLASSVSSSYRFYQCLTLPSYTTPLWRRHPLYMPQNIPKRLSTTIAQPIIQSLNVDNKPNVLIVGSGAAAMTAALRAQFHGLSPLVIEKSSVVGGTTSYSGGGLWIPNSNLHPGVEDSVDEALGYMETLIGDAGPASTRERKLAFLENGPKMVNFLKSEGFKWVPAIGYPDYYPNIPGGKSMGGRSIEGAMFDLKKLGKWRSKLRMNPSMPTPIPLHTSEYTKIVTVSSRTGFVTAFKVFLWRFIGQRLLGRIPATMGLSLTGQLLYLIVKRNIPIWLNSPLKELIVKDGTVVGAIIEREGKEVVVEVARGVLLAAGGFAQNAEMRKKYQESPITADWTSTTPNDTGDAISAALKVGAGVALMDDAWWGPSFVNPKSGERIWCQQDRALPHSIVVDKAGNRFTDEAQSYTTFVHDQYRRNKTVPAIPALLVFDSMHRKKYRVAGISPGKLPSNILSSGLIVKAETLSELAQKIDVDPKGLQDTVNKFNIIVAKGIDEDYNRGGSAYDRYGGDPSYSLNPNLGTIEKGPFYAARLWPGDLGTKGGILTDQFSRALKDDGTVIRNLYAAGNSSASVMGREYPGAGSTLGPALTFAFIAMDDISSRSV